MDLLIGFSFSLLWVCWLQLPARALAARSRRRWAGGSRRGEDRLGAGWHWGSRRRLSAREGPEALRLFSGWRAARRELLRVRQRPGVLTR